MFVENVRAKDHATADDYHDNGPILHWDEKDVVFLFIDESLSSLRINQNATGAAVKPYSDNEA